MDENKSVLLQNSMHYGLILGAFWTVKYIFFILGSYFSDIGIIYWIVSPLTVILAFYMTKAYKLMIGGKIGFFHAWQFGILLFFFAALIVSLPHYIFYRYFAPSGFLETSMNQAIEIMKNNIQLTEQMKEIADKITMPSPIQMTIQGVLNNVFYGIILSIPIAALLCRNNVSGTIYQSNQEKDDR